ncbi:unnamed protein product [Lactuca virosa]|uniref:Ubiquitin-like protease family profile domain-containing protein n=1 Tax=Lactuca virosa TaxID=75947 RepID=A0AAU9M8I1_9ASTR|nr:unnamed protein product [Lactuca virosa]
MKSIGNPHERVDERIRSGKPLSKATIDVVDAQLLDQAHLYVLRNTVVVEPYIEQHMLELKDLNLRHARKSTWLQSQHSQTFISWFKKEVRKRLANGEDICDDVRWLAKGPNFAVSKYSGFAINEYRFHTTSRDESRTTQCSGVSLVAHTLQIASAKDSNPVYGALKRTKAKNTRAHHKYNHRLSRKGYARLINDIMQETSKTEEEIDRTLLWKKARELKTGGYESDVKMIVDKIDELQKSGSFGEVTFGTYDVLTEALGTQEQRGRVRGMGKFITPQQYFYLPKNVKYYLDIENERVDKRINKLEDDLEKLKRGVLNVSEAASCQVGGVIEDVEKERRDESLDNSCLLAVEFGANVVAKGTIMKYSASNENIEVMMETILQGEALIPIPLEEEFIVKVKDALGHILSWPRHLVIRCYDLGKVVAKPMKKHATPVKKDETPMKEDATPLKEEIGSKKKEKGTGKMGDGKKEPCDVEEGNDMEEGNGIKKKIKKEKQNVTLQRRWTRAQMKTRIRIEKSSILKMTEIMADGQVTKVDSIKLQSENDLFGYDSYTYLSWDDFEAVLTMDELTGAVIVSYMMVLFNKMKYGPPERDHGICFVNPTLISPSMRKGKSKNIDVARRGLANRLSNRKGKDIIFMPYNPGRHWVVGVLDMKSDTCYYLDSLSSGNFNMAMVMYATQSGSNKKVKLNWVNVTCPVQPGSTECGYYMLRFMNEIMEEGIEVLVKDNIGGGKVVYTTDDIDEIREEWTEFVTGFIYR